MAGTLFESIMFRGDVLEISYTESHDRGEGVAMVRTLIVEAPRKVPQEYADFMDALQALVDAGQLALRNPPERLERR